MCLSCQEKLSTIRHVLISRVRTEQSQEPSSFPQAKASKARGPRVALENPGWQVIKLLMLFSLPAAPGGFLLSPHALRTFSLGGEVLLKQRNQLGGLPHGSDMVPVLTSDPCRWQVHIWAHLVFFSPFAAVEVQAFTVACSPRKLVLVHPSTPTVLCSPAAPWACLAVVTSAGSDSFPSKWRILLPLCEL